MMPYLRSQLNKQIHQLEKYLHSNSVDEERQKSHSFASTATPQVQLQNKPGGYENCNSSSFPFASVDRSGIFSGPVEREPYIPKFVEVNYIEDSTDKKWSSPCSYLPWHNTGNISTSTTYLRSDNAFIAAYSGMILLPYFGEIDPSTIDVLLITRFHLDNAASLPYFFSGEGYVKASKVSVEDMCCCGALINSYTLWILRRCLNTAASDFKTIGGGQSKSKSESITKAQSEAGSQSASDSKSNLNGHSDSKSNFNGHSESGSRSVNHGQARFADHGNALRPALFDLAKFSIITGCIAVPIAYLIDDWITKARVDNYKREALEILEKKAEEFWRGRVEELKQSEEEADNEFRLAIQELKKERMERGILRRCLYTAASDSKTISNGQFVSDAGPQSVNYGQARQSRFYGLERISLFGLALDVPVFTVVAFPLISSLNKSKPRARREAMRNEVDEALDVKYSMDSEGYKDWSRKLEGFHLGKLSK
ncbi:hypothetical protein FNV43_RR14164 [Rhamnella rubrinervis]|uniref:Uncharacterized protein n=1 Tax=Rhamnella rubrinervis TaxID=2594499 RepID=A0A8K0MG29_9ROSA|nr:hypothetical protein FNV43_RR14164 [Rhamnella rubrinervis]